MGDTGSRIAYIAVALSSASIHGQLTVDSFGAECYSCIVDETGESLYRYAEVSSPQSTENIFESVEQYEVLNNGSVEQLREAMRSGANTALEFAYRDEQTGQRRDWFVANASVHSVGWNVMLFVPTDVLGAGTEGLLTQTSLFFVIVSCIVLLVFLIMMYVIVASHADKRVIREKEAANLLLEEAAINAESANMAKSQFLSRMSHDIRTPINAIMGMTGIALKHLNDAARVQDCLVKIDSSSQHLFSLINDVLDMSRIESGKNALACEPFNLGACLANCASIIEGQLVTRKLNFVRDFEPLKNQYVIGDELHLRQIFINILGNSVKFTPDGGTITFRMRQISQQGKTAFCFTLEDTGIGMKEDFLPYIFDAFTQEDGGSRTNYKGTGLGMTIVKQFVDMLGGTIQVESKLNVGTKFVVVIPMELDETPRPMARTGSTRADLEGMHVLLVEDNELNLEIAEEMLEDRGVEVTTAENGKQALEAFVQTEPGTFDAILMDVMMPEMDGLTATRSLRALERPDARSVPVLAMTANAYDEDIRRTHEAGMNAHLSKPIDVNMLFATLANYYHKAS